MPRKFLDDVANGSGVIALTDSQRDKQTKSQTDTTENNAILATLRCAGGNHHLVRGLQSAFSEQLCNISHFSRQQYNKCMECHTKSFSRETILHVYTEVLCK